MIDIDSLTIKEIKHIQSLLKCTETKENSPYQVGQSYLFRLVTLYYTGRVKRVTPKEIILEDAAWIADTGRSSLVASKEFRLCGHQTRKFHDEG